MQLDALFRPQSVAIIGASDKPTPGRRVIASLERIGFAGRIYPVNPNYATVMNRACYASVADLPEAPDLAVFCLGHARVLDAFVAAAERGIKAAVSPYNRSTSYLQELRDPAGLAGNVGIISHSGGLCVGLVTDTRRFGFSHIVSSGNEAALVAADYLEYLIEDPHTAMIGGFIETIRQPERFAAALDRAAARGKPVVMVKIGKHERTRRAVVSHTGGEAGEPAEISALLRDHRVIEVADVVELTEVLAALQSPKRPAGPRLGVITSSGGLAELILDVAAAADLQLPPLSTAQQREITAGIGFITGDGNPLDAWGSGAFAANLPQALSLFDASPEHDAIVLLRDNFDGQPFDVPETAQAYLELFVRGAERSAKPHYLLTTRPGLMDRALAGFLREHGVAVVGGIREGLGAIDKVARNAC
jgi:acyl-CoA synthetase (NDP forming)